MNFIKSLLLKFTKLDTLLAFIVSTILYMIFTKDYIKSIIFSLSFVIIFLVLLTLTEFI